MATYFRTGTKDIAEGAVEVSVTGLALDFTPGSVQVSCRQPQNDADIISAYVTGTPTTDGFTAVLSSPTPLTGYKLDYTISSAGGSQPVDTGTLAADYTTLKQEVAHFLGYDAAALTAAQAAEIDRYIQSGLRQFYYPPAMEGVDVDFEWDFMRQDGSVTTTANTAEYVLPDGFGRFAGQLTFADPSWRQTVPVIPYGDLLRMLKGRPDEKGRPLFAATMAQNAYGEKGQKKKVYFFPTPDAAYTLKFACDADTGKIDAATKPFPLGGPMFAELVIESCLAIAEQKANDEIGAHTAKFQQLLVSMIQRNRKAGAQVYGNVGDPDAWRW